MHQQIEKNEKKIKKKNKVSRIHIEFEKKIEKKKYGVNVSISIR